MMRKDIVWTGLEVDDREIYEPAHMLSAETVEARKDWQSAGSAVERKGT